MYIGRHASPSAGAVRQPAQCCVFVPKPYVASLQPTILDLLAMMQHMDVLNDREKGSEGMGKTGDGESARAEEDRSSGGKKKYLVIADIDGTIFDYELYEKIRRSAGERGERIDWRREGARLGIEGSRKILEELSGDGEIVYLTARMGDADAGKGKLKDATWAWLRYMNYPEGLVVMRKVGDDGKAESNYDYKKNAIQHLLSGEGYERAHYMRVVPIRERRKPDGSDVNVAGWDIERYKEGNFEIVLGFGNEPHDIWAYLENYVVPLIYIGEGNPRDGEVLHYIRENGMGEVVYTFDSWDKVPGIVERLGVQGYREWKERAEGFMERFSRDSR